MYTKRVLTCSLCLDVSLATWWFWVWWEEYWELNAFQRIQVNNLQYEKKEARSWSKYSLGWPGTHYVDQPGLKSIKIGLPQKKNRGHTEAYVYERKQQTVLFKGKKEGLLPLMWLFESVFRLYFVSVTRFTPSRMENVDSSPGVVLSAQ